MQFYGVIVEKVIFLENSFGVTRKCDIICVIQNVKTRDLRTYELVGEARTRQVETKQKNSLNRFFE
jgi:hypothetical protein